MSASNSSESSVANCLFNTFIFNFVENYDDQVNALEKAMASLKNRVKIYNHLSEQELIEVVDSLAHTSFGVYNYIVIIILDNKCKYEQFIRTSDQQDVLLYSEIITKIETNPTLYGIPRLFVIQKLLDVRDMDDDELDVINEMINEREMKTQTETQTETETQKTKAVYFGLSVTIRANEMNENFKKSPFLEVFSQKFQDQAEKEEIIKIANEIRKEIKEKRDYKIDIVMGSNEFSTSNLIFGQGISCNASRDFW